MTKLVLALDVGKERLKDLLNHTVDFVKVFKVGHRLLAEEPKVIELLKNLGKKVMLDLKLYDIPNTVKLAFQAYSKRNVDFLTVHISAGRRCLKEISAFSTIPVGITVLTSFSKEECEEVYGDPPPTVAERLFRLGRESGLTHFVCSGFELPKLKTEFPEGKFFVPGVRLKRGSDDQRRVVTPKEAKDAGADYIVVGREIYDSENPKEVVLKFLKELQGK